MKETFLNILYRGIWILFTFGVFYTAGFMLKFGEPDKLRWLMVSLPFSIWASVPFLINLIFSMRHRNSLIGLVITFITMLIITFGGFYLLWQSFVVQPEQLSGLAFIVLPILQIVISLIGMGIVLIINALTRI